MLFYGRLADITHSSRNTKPLQNMQSDPTEQNQWEDLLPSHSLLF